MRNRVALLAERGTSVRAPFEAPGGRPMHLRTCHGRTPAEPAALYGCPAVLAWLAELGEPRPAPAGVDGFIAAVLTGDRATAGQLRGYAARAIAERPGLIVWAAARRAWQAIPLLAELGFDINAKARTRRSGGAGVGGGAARGRPGG